MNPAQFFESLSCSVVEDFVDTRQEESLHLDFKLLKDAAFSSGDDKRNLAKALSGFANSSGGVIVWGVDARKNADGVDCATATVPIVGLAHALTRLNSLTGDSAEPTVGGVLHRSLATADDVGYLATLVPESDRGPHMAKLGEDRYYKRSGDSFYKMEHFDIADMFGRRRRPAVQLAVEIQGIGAGVQVDVGLHNAGRIAAKNVYLALACSSPFSRSQYGLNGNGKEGMPYIGLPNSRFPWTYEGGSDWVLHAGVTRLIARLNMGLLPKHEPEAALEISYAVACDDQPLETKTVVVPLHRLRAGA
jgi:Putative DNA-binding domain